MSREQHWEEYKRLSVKLVELAYLIATSETAAHKAQRQWVWDMTRKKRLGHMQSALGRVA